MAWFTELAGKAENLLNNLDEKTASVLQKNHKTEVMYAETQPWLLRPTRRPTIKSQKKITETRSNYSPTRKAAPVKPLVKFSESARESTKNSPSRRPVKKSHTYHFPPHTMVDDEKLRLVDDNEVVVRDYGSSFRRKSLPNGRDYETMIRNNTLEALKTDNDLLKNEVAVCNQEISELLDKLRALEYDMKEAEAKYENLEKLYTSLKEEKESLVSELETLKRSGQESSPCPEHPNLASAYRALQGDYSDVVDQNQKLQEQVKQMEMTKVSSSSIQMKLENDLRFAHLTMNELQADLEKSRHECRRVQADWDAYKLRVKSMLLTKDKEIQALQKGSDSTEGTKILVEQVEALREDRSQMSCAVARARDECAEVARRAEQAEARAHAAERLVAALREALREERLARNRAENQCILNNKELKSLQMETGQQLAALQMSLREREHELRRLAAGGPRSAASVCAASDASALNVAERAHDTHSSERVQLLTQSLLAKQGRLDALLADNNTLRLQIEKLEVKHRREVSNLQSNQRVIQVTDGDALLKTKIGGRGYVAGSVMSKASLQIGVYMRRHPVFRFFIIMYMACLHIWVLVVLLTYTPEVHSP